MPAQSIDRTHWSRVLGPLAALLLALVLAAPAMADGTPATGAVKAPATAGVAIMPAVAEAGLVGPNSYRSPHFDYTADWSGNVYLQARDPDHVYTTTNPTDDVLVLSWTGEEDCQGIVLIDGKDSNFGSARKQVADWISDDYVASNFPTHVQVSVLDHQSRGDSGEVLYSLVDTAANNEQDYSIFQDIELDNGARVKVLFSNYGWCLEDAFADVTATVTVNGQPILSMLDWERIERAIGG